MTPPSLPPGLVSLPELFVVKSVPGLHAESPDSLSTLSALRVGFADLASRRSARDRKEGVCVLAGLYGLTRAAHRCAVHPGALADRPEPVLQARAQTTNGDGFGVGWYDAASAPGLFRSVEPAWNGQNLRELADHISSHEAQG